MIEVHHFKIWNDQMKHWEKPPAKRSAEAIAEIKGEIVPDTGEMVFKAQLDVEGRYFPPPANKDV